MTKKPDGKLLARQFAISNSAVMHYRLLFCFKGKSISCSSFFSQKDIYSPHPAFRPLTFHLFPASKQAGHFSSRLLFQGAVYHKARFQARFLERWADYIFALNFKSSICILGNTSLCDRSWRSWRRKMNKSVQQAKECGPNWNLKSHSTLEAAHLSLCLSILPP
jgi:hypothetical protein